MKKGKFQRGLLLWGIGLILGAMVLMGAGCSTIGDNIRDAEKYTKANKITLGIMIAAQFADAYTTDQGIKAGARELNPLLGTDKPDTETIFLFSGAMIALKWWGGHILPAKWRNWLWGGSAVINSAAAVNNYGVWQEMEARND